MADSRVRARKIQEQPGAAWSAESQEVLKKQKDGSMPKAGRSRADRSSAEAGNM